MLAEASVEYAKTCHICSISGQYSRNETCSVATLWKTLFLFFVKKHVAAENIFLALVLFLAPRVKSDSKTQFWNSFVKHLKKKLN